MKGAVMARQNTLSPGLPLFTASLIPPERSLLRILAILSVLLLFPVAGRIEGSRTYSDTGIEFSYADDLTFSTMMDSVSRTVDLQGPDYERITVILSPHKQVLDAIRDSVIPALKSVFPNVGKTLPLKRDFGSIRLTGSYFAAEDFPGSFITYEFFTFPMTNRFVLIYYTYSTYRNNQQKVTGNAGEIIESLQETGKDLDCGYFIGQSRFSTNKQYRQDRLDRALSVWTMKDPATNYIIASLERAFLTGEMAVRAENFSIPSELAKRFPDEGGYLHLKLGDFYRGMGRLDDAVSNYRRSLALLPANPGAYAGMGLAAECAGNTGEAVSNLVKAARFPAADVSVYYALARLFEKTGNRTNALKCFAWSAAVRQRECEPYLRRAAFFSRIGDFTSAIDDLKYAAALVNHQQDKFSAALRCYGELSRTLAESGDPDAGLAAAQEMVEKFPNYANSFGVSGRAFLRLKRWQDAREDFATFLRSSPGNAAGYADMGIYFWLAKKNKKKAIEFYRKALENRYDPRAASRPQDDGAFLQDLLPDPEFKALLEQFKRQTGGCGDTN
jgi:tetratricopeptide (TPR) repeat protein